jgi:hypothetical protein
MDERKGYANTDELQADDQISPRPSAEGEDVRRRRPADGATCEGSDDQRLPRPATSE